ncbi:MAG: hypothetical protein ABWZ77_06605 [Naasia sp.]
MTDEMVSQDLTLGSALTLVGTGDSNEYLVRRQDSAESLAVAVIRAEPQGVFAYPHRAPYRRLGPFRSPSEALASCEIELSEPDPRMGEYGGA